MFPIAIFSSICIAAIAFMLRFIVALEIESRQASQHSGASTERFSSNRSHQPDQVWGPAGLRVVHSNSPDQVAFQIPQHEYRSSQYRRA